MRLVYAPPLIVEEVKYSQWSHRIKFQETDRYYSSNVAYHVLCRILREEYPHGEYSSWMFDSFVYIRDEEMLSFIILKWDN